MTDHVDQEKNLLVPLAHTWLYIPRGTHPQVTSFQDAQTPDGIAYTAALSLDHQPVGVLHNSGQGGPTVFHGHDRSGLDAMTAFVATCRSHDGGVPPEEWLFDELLTSWTLGEAITTARRTGQRVIRALDVWASPDDPSTGAILTGDVRILAPFDQAQRATLAVLLAEMRIPGLDRWWQEWTEPVAGTGATTSPGDKAGERDGRWNDLTPRPKTAPSTDPVASRCR
jgi:hypothetical protein